jgi:hypothetical protein
VSLHPAHKLLKHEHRLLGLMIASLLAAVALIDDVYLSKSLLIVHFGLFLLWQPVLQQEESFSVKHLIVLLVFLFGFIIWFNLWTSTFWILLLMSLLTGRIFARGLRRAIYGISVVILFLQIILIITPQLFSLTGLNATLQTSVQTILISVSLLLLFSPSDEQQTTHVDFIRGFMVVLLTLFLCMGSVLSAFTSGNQYLPSLATTIVIAALFLFAMALLWTPRAGFTGLAQLWEKYLLNIGGPFEQWVSQLAALEANTNIKPDGFLETCIHYLLERHWICGLYWKTDKHDMMEGIQSKYHVSYSDSKLRITLYAYNPVGPALLLHTKLLLSVLTFYYRAKLQEQQLIKQAHLRAIYETGSKLTHDIKNILQSTQLLTQVIADDQTTVEDARGLLKTQLPLLTQRLKTTLDKLSTPERNKSELKKLSIWWQQLQSRYTGRHIVFEAQLVDEKQIPVEVFDTVVENLLDNARSKRIGSPQLQIDVSLHSDATSIRLAVSDSGDPVAADIQEHLFAEVISSENGFGIGLYQSRQMALRSGFDLSLDHNEVGNVCFVLVSK